MLPFVTSQMGTQISVFSNRLETHVKNMGKVNLKIISLFKIF